MTVSELIQSIDSHEPSPVYLLCPDKAPRGKTATFEPMLADQAVSLLIDRFVEPGMKDMCLTSVYADETPSGEVVSVADTLPFLADRRVVLVRNAEHYDSEKAAGPLLPYLENPCESTVLILVAGRIDRRLKLFKACTKAGMVVGCAHLTDHELATWVRNETESIGKSIDPGAVREITNRAGHQLSEVRSALHQAAGYAGDRAKIMETDVIAACAEVAEEEVWALTDAIGGSDSDAAVHALRRILDLGKSEFEVMGSVHWVIRSAYQVARGDTDQLSPFVAKKFGPLARKWGVNKSGAALGLLMDAEMMLRSTGVDRALALELLVIKLSASTKRAKATTT